MCIELLDNNKLEIGMKIYIQGAIMFFDGDVSTKVSSPANQNTHDVNPDSPTIPKE